MVIIQGKQLIVRLISYTSAPYPGHYELHLISYFGLSAWLIICSEMLTLILHHSSADSRLAFCQWQTSLQSNAVSHWLGANIESTHLLCFPMGSDDVHDNYVIMTWTRIPYYWPFLRGICQSPVDPPNKGPVMQNVFFILCSQNKVLNKLSCCRGFMTPWISSITVLEIS